MMLAGVRPGQALCVIISFKNALEYFLVKKQHRTASLALLDYVVLTVQLNSWKVSVAACLTNKWQGIRFEVSTQSTHLWICVRTDSGATRRLGYHFLRVQVGNHWSLGVLKRRRGRYVFTTAWRGLRLPMPSKCPWAPRLKQHKTIQKNPCDYKGHTHTPPRGEAKS